MGLAILADADMSLELAGPCIADLCKTKAERVTVKLWDGTPTPPPFLTQRLIIRWMKSS
jgi:hypothetical protein